MKFTFLALLSDIPLIGTVFKPVAAVADLPTEMCDDGVDLSLE